nr:beta-glucuronosyltransferase GlcAT14B-like [Ipomoea batatas]
MPGRINIESIIKRTPVNSDDNRAHSRRLCQREQHVNGIRSAGSEQCRVSDAPYSATYTTRFLYGDPDSNQEAGSIRVPGSSFSDLEETFRRIWRIVSSQILTETPSGIEPLSSTDGRLLLLTVYQVGSKLKPIPVSALSPPLHIAYLISGSVDDGDMLQLTLQALYHPNNQDVVHLDAEPSSQERLDHATTCRLTILSPDSTMSE